MGPEGPQAGLQALLGGPPDGCRGAQELTERSLKRCCAKRHRSVRLLSAPGFHEAPKTGMGEPLAGHF